jgi:hypothetical protein
VHAQRPWEPPRLYSWTIVGGAGAGAVGVTDDYELALDEVVDALASAQAGSRGLVHRVSLSFIRTGFVYEGLIARCRIDPAGDVAWDNIPPPSTWTHLRPMYTDPGQALGDAIPPEALTTGLADLQDHRDRLDRTTSSNSTDQR